MTETKPFIEENKDWVLTMKMGDVIDPSVFDCNRIHIKANKLRTATIAFLMAQFNKLAKFSPKISQKSTPFSPEKKHETQQSAPSINSQDAQSNPDLFKLKSNKKYKKNPLFGYRIKEFVACQPGTEVLRVSHPLFMTFLERSVIN